MSLIKWNPDSSFLPSFSPWMDDFLPENGFSAMMKGVALPAVNIKESNEAFSLELAVPGFKKGDFKLEVKEGYLVVSGERKEEKEDKDERFTRREYVFNSFNRSFSMPAQVNAEQIAAQYSDGVLKITLPKTQAVEKPVKQISVA